MHGRVRDAKREAGSPHSFLSYHADLHDGFPAQRGDQRNESVGWKIHARAGSGRLVEQLAPDQLDSIGTGEQSAAFLRRKRVYQAIVGRGRPDRAWCRDWRR
jgi:hypothetical protein